jgi:uncharacterized membrane protein
MDYSLYLVGPHLIGVLFIVIGLVQYYLPPKKINRWYGYRTPAARSSQQAWDEGNRFSAIYMMKAGLVLLIAGFFVYAGMIRFNVNIDTLKLVNYVIMFGGAMTVAILSVVITEKHLRKTLKIPAIKRPELKKRR